MIKKRDALFTFCLFASFVVQAQNKHETIWLFGSGHSVDFSSGSPVAGGIPEPLGHTYYVNYSPGNYVHATACDTQGQLLFFTQINSRQGSDNLDYTFRKPKVFDRKGNPLPHGNIQANMYTGGSGHSGQPIIVPYPRQNDKYLLFYVHNDALLYSVVDMRLNGGMGDIDTGSKDIIISPYNTLVGYKMTTIQGCTSIWLIARSRIANEYLSFEINEHGVNPIPVVSKCGTLSAKDYLLTDVYYFMPEFKYIAPGGSLQASNTHKMIAAGTYRGVELYDFEPCSGQLKNARMLDTMGVYGVCFSPDDSKLYTTQLYGWPRHGKVFQYDLNQASLEATWNSKALILENPLLLWPLGQITSGFLGDLKLAVNGKIYITNNADWPGLGTFMPQPVFPATSVWPHQGLHVIHQPNLPGLACQPELSKVPLKGNVITESGLFLPKSIVTMPAAVPDTIPGHTYAVSVCFNTATLLTAAPGKSCYVWEDGNKDPQRSVIRSGTYWVHYYQGCSITVDTYQVHFISLPELPEVIYGCPDELSILLPEPKEATRFTYSLYRADSLWSRLQANRHGASLFVHLAEGRYRLRIQSEDGCDTTIMITLQTYPVPEIVALPTDTTIHYGERITLQASGGVAYSWWPPDLFDPPNSSQPILSTLEPITLGVSGINEYGCRDTAFVQVHIDYTLPDLLPNAFSPNGDGLNDVFRMEGITYQQVVYLRVYNRFGQEVYAGYNHHAGWDGTFKGRYCDAGTYYYQVELAYPDGRRKTMKGDVVLLR